jgi:hypothetical protein
VTQVWPITANLRAPDWASDPIVGEQPIAINTFASKSESRLRLSSVQVGGEFTITWAPALYPLVSELLAFHRLVGQFEDFTLPAGFFVSACPAARAQLYLDLSPTGRWRFKSQPALNEIELRVQQCFVSLIACTD